MKLGAQDRTKAKWAVGLFVVAIVLAVYNFGLGRKSGSPVPSVHEPEKAGIAGNWKPIRDPALRDYLFQRRQTFSFVSNRNIFTMQQEERAINPDAGAENTAKHDDGKVTPAGEQALPFDLKYFGYFRKSGEPKKVCVSQGEAVFLAQEGSLVGLRYRILEIKNNSVVVRDVLSNQQQSLILLQ
jgi:hypothetical protein